MEVTPFPLVAPYQFRTQQINDVRPRFLFPYIPSPPLLHPPLRGTGLQPREINSCLPEYLPSFQSQIESLMQAFQTKKNPRPRDLLRTTEAECHQTWRFIASGPAPRTYWRHETRPAQIHKWGHGGFHGLREHTATARTVDLNACYSGYLSFTVHRLDLSEKYAILPARPLLSYRYEHLQ